MKRSIITFVSLLIMQTFTLGQTLSQENAWNIVKSQVLKNDTTSISAFISQTTITPNSLITTINGNENSPQYTAWFIFIDDFPFENWGHPCRYIYVNSQNGEVEINIKNCPPKVETMIPLIKYKPETIKGTPFKKARKNRINIQKTNYNTDKCYAVIISGGASPYNNYERYWNDCSFIYQTLIESYNYTKDHIYVLMSDGKDIGADLHLNNDTYISSPLDLDGDEVDDIQYAATRSNVTNVFNILDSILTEDDHLFIFTTDHGSLVSGQHATMNLWNYEILHDYEFASYINRLNAGNISICMEQCYSGGFIDDITRENITISTACRYDETSYSSNNYQYDEFVYHWIAAVNGSTPTGITTDADYNNDGKKTLYEAFCYAEANDTKNEHPQYLSRPTSLGSIIDLSLCYDPIWSYIVGPNSFNTSQNYYIEGLTENMSVYWSIDNNNFSISSSDSTCTIEYLQNLSYDTAILSAQIYIDDLAIKTITKQIVHIGDIHGNGVLCDNNIYIVTGCIEDLNITWNIDNPSFTITPSDTICVVTYNDTLQYDHATLTAVLSCNGDSLATLSKRIVAHGTNLVVEGWQDETITSNGTSPENQFIIPDGEEIGEPFPDDEFQEEIDGDLEAIPIDSIFTHNPHSHSSGNTTIQGTANIYGGTWLQLTSTRFDGMDINFSGSIAPELFYRVSPTELRLLMPYMENTYDVDLMASSPGGCHDFALRFNVNLLPGNVYGDEDLYIHFVGSHIGITLMCAEDITLENGQVQLPTWTLGIVNAQTGQWVHNATIQGQATSVNTANWANGVYIIRAGYNHNIYTKKFTLAN